jgi:ribosomal protein S18 acetylase RimI-like enzyme
VREACPDDAPAVAALWTEAYVTLGGGGRTESYADADFVDTAACGEVFVAERDDAIAGVVALLPPLTSVARCIEHTRVCRIDRTARAVARAEEAELARLAVAVDARGAGIGRALTVLCGERARAAGWDAIALWSRPYQHEAHLLYESLGYERVPERDTVDETGHGRLVLRLTLGGGKV